ncbi:MAG: NifU family protein [Bacilli bacterium]|nr:NifU family protein [Bacilli bacterium]
MENTIDKIKDIINKLKPFLISEGGNIEFIDYKDNIVYIKMMGACANCEMLDVTLKEGIEASIKSEIPEVKEIINVE